MRLGDSELALAHAVDEQLVTVRQPLAGTRGPRLTCARQGSAVRGDRHPLFGRLLEDGRPALELCPGAVGQLLRPPRAPVGAEAPQRPARLEDVEAAVGSGSEPGELRGTREADDLAATMSPAHDSCVDRVED